MRNGLKPSIIACMAISTLLQTVYSSAPPEELLLETIEINVPGLEPLRYVDGFEDKQLAVSGSLGSYNYHLFKASTISIALPTSGSGGNQSLRFGFAGAADIAEPYIRAAVEGGSPSTLVYRQYLDSNKQSPCRTPYTMTIIGGQIKGGDVVFEAAYMDMLNLAWPRERYTSENAPGVRYM